MTEKKIHTLELGRIYEEQGYFKKAADHFSGALKNDPGNPILIKAFDRANAAKADSRYPIDRSSDNLSLSGIVEQWVYLIILKQRAARLAHNSER